MGRAAAQDHMGRHASSPVKGKLPPQQHPQRPKRERRQAPRLLDTYPATQTHSNRTELARDKRHVALATLRSLEEIVPAAALVEVKPTLVAPEEPKAKKQARPSKRTSEVQTVEETPAEAPEPEQVVVAEVLCSVVLTMAQKARAPCVLNRANRPRCPTASATGEADPERELEIDPELPMLDAVHFNYSIR